MLPPIARKSLFALILCSVSALAACQQADCGADIHNRTSNPVFAQLMVRANDRTQPAVLAASRRLGPGDRAPVGSVRTNVHPGAVYILVHALPDSGNAASLDLSPGTAFLEVTQEDRGPLRVHAKR
jgi:multisubunit Na+/H+ antiporter MnhE subunit